MKLFSSSSRWNIKATGSDSTLQPVFFRDGKNMLIALYWMVQSAHLHLLSKYSLICLVLIKNEITIFCVKIQLMFL